MPEPLQDVIDRLELAASRLRAGELSSDRAAALVDECARLAVEAGSELDRLMRIGDAPPGQLALSA